MIWEILGQAFFLAVIAGYGWFFWNLGNTTEVRSPWDLICWIFTVTVIGYVIGGMIHFSSKGLHSAEQWALCVFTITGFMHGRHHR